jgi:membrane protein required for colicin V production
MIFDLIILLLLGISAWRGWRNGFIMEVFYLLFIFVSIYIAIHFSNWVALKWGGEIPNAYGLKAFVITMVVAAVSMFVVAKMASSVIKSGTTGSINSFAGAFFSVFKTALLLSVVLLMLEKLQAKVNWISRDQKEQSWLYEPMYKLTFVVLPAIEESAVYKNGLLTPTDEVEINEKTPE